MKPSFLIVIIVLLLLVLYTGAKGHHLLAIPEQIVGSYLLGAGFFSLIILWQLIYNINPRVLDFGWFKILTWVGSIGMGVWATFVIFSIPLDLFYWMISIFSKQDGEINHLRRTFLSHWTAVGLGGISTGIAGFGYFQANAGPNVKVVTVPIQGLPDELQGMRIAQISDLHVGPTIDRTYVETVVRKVMALKADLIAVTGDLADGTPEVLASRLQPLAELQAPLGTFYVTGNHEYYWGADRWVEKAKGLGFIPLMNENRVVHLRGQKILVGGVTDTHADQFIPSHRSDPAQAARSTQFLQCGFRLLLAHRPDSCFEAEPKGFHLQLSGHTHAGQFFPWNMIVRLAHKYYRGLNKHGKMWVYVNVGTGYWGPVHRFLVPSEITLIELQKAIRPVS